MHCCNLYCAICVSLFHWVIEKSCCVNFVFSCHPRVGAGAYEQVVMKR